MPAVVIPLVPERSHWVARFAARLTRLAPVLQEDAAHELAVDLCRAWPRSVPEMAAMTYLALLRANNEQ